MKILAIETATEACSVALAIDEMQIERFKIAPRKHTELILPMIKELLGEAGIKIKDLDAIAFGQGPGAFTGVRVAIGAVQGLAFAHDIPVIPISTLAALAQQVANEHDFVASAIDARMQEVYWALFQKNEMGLMAPLSSETVCAPSNVDTLSRHSWFGVGSGWIRYENELSSQFDTNLTGYNGNLYPSAGEVLNLAKPYYRTNQMVSVEQASPVYLRNKVTQ